MVHTSAAGTGTDSSRRTTAVSLALHGVIVAVVIAFVGRHPPAPPPLPVGLTDVQVVDKAPSAAPAAPTPPTPPLSHKAGPRTGAGVHGRREAVQRAEPVAPRTMQTLADVQIHDEDKTQFADHDRAKLAEVTSGIGLSGIGVAGVDIPDATGGGSLARGPKPKRDYTNLRVGGASKFAGQKIRLRLSIDVHGKVQSVKILQGVDPDIDRKTIALVRKFEYEPAHGDDGTPIAGTQRWEFEVVEDDELAD